jgi:membrane peptidoglycan carboxypeptidase
MGKEDNPDGSGQEELDEELDDSTSEFNAEEELKKLQAAFKAFREETGENPAIDHGDEQESEQNQEESQASDDKKPDPHLIKLADRLKKSLGADYPKELDKMKLEERVRTMEILEITLKAQRKRRRTGRSPNARASTGNSGGSSSSTDGFQVPGVNYSELGKKLENREL